MKKQSDVSHTLQEADRQFTLGNTLQGHDWCDKAVAIDPDSPDTYLGTSQDSPVQSPGLIALLQQHGQYPDLVQYLTQATAKPKLSDNWKLYRALADAQLHVGNQAGAQAAYVSELGAMKKQFTTPGATISTGDSAELLVSRADAEWGSGDQASALKDYHDAITTFPDPNQAADIKNHEAYSEALSRTRLSEALTLAKDAVNTARESDDDPTLGAYMDTLGWVEHQMGDDRDAVNDLDQAASLLPTEGDVAFHLASVYQAVGRNQDAIIEYQRTLQLQPYNAGAQQALNTLNKRPPTVAAKPA